MPANMLVSLGLSVAMTASPGPQPHELRAGLAIANVSQGGRVPFPRDAVFAAATDPRWAGPKEGDGLSLPDGRRVEWTKAEANAEGWFEGAALRSGYVAVSVTEPAPRVAILEAPGSGLVLVNGQPRAGDPYGYGYLRLPIQLKQGENWILASAARGRVRLSLRPAPDHPILEQEDATLPDVVREDGATLIGGVTVINPTSETISNLRIFSRAGTGESSETSLPPIPPMTIRKVAFNFEPPPGERGSRPLVVRLMREGVTLDTKVYSIEVVQATDIHRMTFISRIDDSVQYFAVNPALKPSPENLLVLSLHGASVEAIGQARAYGRKDDVTLVAPTNRRPYGFDWEDVGRRDGLEVLELAQRSFDHDPARVHLTGHSMGGHGAWHFGVMFADRFGVTAPAAAWSSFFSYGGTPRLAGADGIERIFMRALAPSDTNTYVRNTLASRLYIMHGDADETVPVREARQMYELIKPFHPNVTKYEHPNGSHWYGGESVDWPPMFDLMRSVRRPLPHEVDTIEFWTPNPMVASRHNWLRVEQQIRSMEPSSVIAKAEGDVVTVTTDNVAWFGLDEALLRRSLRGVVVDGQRFTLADRPERGVRWFRRQERVWNMADAPRPRDKSAVRSGPFKEVFDRKVVFVYGTRGSAAEVSATFDAARMLAETFAYRGNSGVAVVADRDFNPGQFRDRNVLLFGNVDTNSAWTRVLEATPVVVRRGRVDAGPRQFAGSFAAMFVFPRRAEDQTLVGVIGATDARSMAQAARLPILTSGVAYPDWCVFGEDWLSAGLGAVVGAGFFDNTWRIGPADTAWRTPAL